MSITSRARHLARVANLKHQAAINAIRATGEGAKTLVREAQWSLKRADVFLYDPMLDAEYNAVSGGSRSVEHEACDNCGTRFFIGYDKKGYSDGPFEHCPECRDEYGSCQCTKCGREMLADRDIAVCGECLDNALAKD